MKRRWAFGVFAAALLLTMGPATPAIGEHHGGVADRFGEESGHFVAKLIGGLSYRPSKVGELSIEMNMEGTAHSNRLGDGNLSLTHYEEYPVSAKQGTWEHYGGIQFPDGTFLTFQAPGTWTETETGKWRYFGTGQLSNGTPYLTKFAAELETMTFTGKTYR